MKKKEAVRLVSIGISDIGKLIDGHAVKVMTNDSHIVRLICQKTVQNKLRRK